MSLFSFFLCALSLLLHGSSVTNAWLIPRDLDETVLLRSYGDLVKVSHSEPVGAQYLNQSWLHRRQNSCPICPTEDEIDPDTPLCIGLCSSKSESACGAAAAASEQKREVQYQAWNASLETLGSRSLAEEHHLAKRVINPLLAGTLKTYLNNQFDGNNPDPLFGPRTTTLFVNDEQDTTVTESVNLPAANPFQMGAGPLVGCTVVTIVSTRAVYMGHFWEGTAWSCGPTVFAQRCLNWFSQDASTTLVGQGQRLDATKFNQPGDNTRVYIMHPRNGRGNPQSSRYRSKITQLRNAIRTGLGDPSVPMALYNYITIDPDPAQNDPDYDQLGTSERGNALFQFDPNARGPGVNGFRIFYEQHEFQETDDAPGPGSANGIPDI